MKQEKYPGYYTAAEVKRRLHLSEGTLYHYVRTGTLKKHIPPGKKYGLYKIEEIEAFARQIQAFSEEGHKAMQQDTGATFAPVRESDLPALVELALKRFARTADATHRTTWLRKEPRGYYLTKLPDGQVTSYVYFQAMGHETIERYLHEGLGSRSVTADMILKLEPGVPLEVILGGIARDPDRAEDMIVLLRGVRQELERLGREGIIISKVYAFSETIEGRSICAHLGMQQWQEPRGKKVTFVLDVERSNTFILQGYKRGLAEWKKWHIIPESNESATLTSVSSTTIHAPPQRKTVSHRSGSQREASTKQELPPDWIASGTFVKRHGVREATLSEAIRAGRIPAHEGEWKEGRATVHYALDPGQQEAAYLLIRNKQNFHICDVPGCPCQSQKQPSLFE